MPKWHVLGSNILLPWSKLLLFYHMLWLSGHNLAQWLSKYGFWTSCISFTWELVRNTNSQAPPQTSVQFSGSVMSDSSTPWTAAHQASLSIINSRNLLKLMSIESVMPSNHLILCCPFFSCLQSFPASGSLPMSQFFASSGQSVGVSAVASVLPMNIQDLFPLGWIGWISLQSKGLSRVFSNTIV